MSSNSVGYRVRSLMGESSERKFAQLIGMSQSSLSAVLTGNRPSVDKVAAIAQATGTNLTWLATGEGDIHDNALPSSTFIMVPTFETHSSRDSDQLLQELPFDQHVPFSRAYLSRHLSRCNPENLIIIHAKGDSMEPTVKSDDLVMIDTGDKSLDPGLFVCERGRQITIKRLVPEGNQIRVLYDNTAKYWPYVIPESDYDQLNIIGAVVWVGTARP